ncbi:MAG TPA: PTS sugar transporter subunit IIA [Spirochaetia bacterium]|nr:PTS sugar transporter subunit IIA [Spirochaetia bacterium]
MDLAENLAIDQIQVGTSAADKFDVLHEIAALAKKNPALEEYSEEVIFEALDTRERIGSTGFGSRVAMPHCSFDELDRFVVGVLTAPSGIDFQGLDGQKTNVFFFIIGPQPQRNKHVQILSAVSRVLESKDFVDQLIAAPDSAAVQKLLAGHLSVISQDKPAREKSMFYVTIQREAVFDEILELFASVNEGSVSVVETNNASAYLHALPLYSAFWNESRNRFGRIVIACVDRAICNDIVRRINMIAGDVEGESGVMIAIHDLSYVAGSLDF